MEKVSWKKICTLVIGSVVLYWLLNHFSIVTGTIGSLLSLFSPFILGGSLAFIINVPMSAIERRLKLKKSKWKRKYITKENVSLAKLLAKKHYYIALKSVIKSRIKALKTFMKYYPNREIDAVYEELSEERKRLIDPIEPTLKDIVKKWNEEFYEKNKDRL